jgi:ABC-type Mn2+/Zn2+ transport system ATPase subunit
LIDFTVGCCIADTICACLSFVVLITTDGGLVSIDTDPNVKIDNLLKQLSQNSKTVAGLQSDIRAVKEYASELQTLLGSKTIEEEVKKEEENFMALSEDGYLYLSVSLS